MHRLAVPRTGLRIGLAPSASACETQVTATQTIVEEQLVKSRHRVKTIGDDHFVRAVELRILGLVGEGLETSPGFVDKTFLEPAAGDGNFLVAILQRKLAAIEKSYPKEEWPETSLFALASIYGIELLEDNHQDAKAVMLAEFHSFHQAHGTPCGFETDLHRAAAFLIEANIVRGNALTGQTPKGEEIQFSWWHRIDGKPGEVQRDPFTLASLRDGRFDFTVYDSYQACRIEKIHDQEKTDA